MVYELFSTGAPVITEGFQNNKENNERPELTQSQLDETVEMIRTIISALNTGDNGGEASNSEKVLDVLCNEGVQANSSNDPQINMIATQINMMLQQLGSQTDYVLNRLCNENFQNFNPENVLDEDGEDGEDGEDSNNLDGEQNLVENEEEDENSPSFFNTLFDSNNVNEEFTNNNNFNEFNNNEFTVGNGNMFHVDLVLRSLLYACVFYLLASPDTLSYVVKKVPGVKKSNSLLAMMLVFFVVYYLLNLFI
jgi:hypothetical protein